MHILLPDGMKVGVRLLYRLSLFAAQGECLVMRAGKPLSHPQLGYDGPHVLDRTAYPFQFGVRKILSDERRAHIVVAEDGSVVTLGGFV
jgi:hypothetical protein